ncbi:MAG TPA: anti-sigma factor [Chitinophagaceae bacterium]
MNVREYIASGIVESYVLGLASNEEMAEFERMCAAHQEVQLAREAFEKQLEMHSIKNGIQPPVHLQSKIFAELEVESDKLKTNGSFTVDQSAQSQSPVVTMQWWKYAAVASIVLLLGSIGLNIYYANRFNTYKGLYLASRTELANSNKALQIQQATFENSLDILRDTNMAVVKMKGMTASPESMATVYWDKRTKDVYLLVNNLPEPAAGKQYQLWALVNGQPVDAGMLNWDHANVVAPMKNIQQAQGFAITLENAGGTPVPQGTMYVLGNM